MQIYFLLAVLKHKRCAFFFYIFRSAKLLVLHYFRFKFEIFSLIFANLFFREKTLREKYSSFDDEEEEVGNTELFFVFCRVLIEKHVSERILFNPDYDMAMADFTPYYKSPAEIMRMIADLSVLPWWFAEEGNCVKVENMALVSLCRSS